MEKVNTNENSRKKLLKKAALLATAASITGAVTIGGQKSKESDALVGVIITAITTAISVGAGIADGVVSAQNAEKEKKRAEEEARRQAEEERIRQQLETGSHNIRVEQQSQDGDKGTTGKEINISVADNSDLINGQETYSSSRGVNNSSSNSNKLNKPPSPPKGIQVGGFGVADEEVDETVSNQNTTQEVGETVENIQTENTTTDVTDQNKPPVIQTTTGESIQNTTNKKEPNKQENQNNKQYNSLKDYANKTEASSEQKFELSFEENDSANSYEENSVVQEELVVHGVGIMDGSSQEDIKFDESMVMDEETAENHRLVQEGYLTSEELILFDYGIRIGAIDEDILNSIYETGEISDECYAGAVELMCEIYEELYANE